MKSIEQSFSEFKTDLEKLLKENKSITRSNTEGFFYEFLLQYLVESKDPFLLIFRRNDISYKIQNYSVYTDYTILLSRIYNEIVELTTIYNKHFEKSIGEYNINFNYYIEGAQKIIDKIE